MIDIRTLLDACITSLDIVRTPQQLMRLKAATERAEAAQRKMIETTTDEERSKSQQEFMQAQEEVTKYLSPDLSALATYCATSGLDKIIRVIGERPTEAAKMKNVEVEKARIEAYVAKSQLCGAVVEKSETKNALEAATQCMETNKPCIYTSSEH